jgi:hypothetical protein
MMVSCDDLSLHVQSVLQTPSITNSLNLPAHNIQQNVTKKKYHEKKQIFLACDGYENGKK